MTIGDIYYKQPIIISTIGLTIHDEASWEMDDGLQYPMMVELSVSATILNKTASRVHRNRFGKLSNLDKKLLNNPTLTSVSVGDSNLTFDQTTFDTTGKIDEVNSSI